MTETSGDVRALVEWIAKSLVDAPDEVFVEKFDDGVIELEVEDLWPHKGLLVLKFRGVDSISEAEPLIGSELQVPAAHRAKLQTGWNYVSDLVGCTVLDRSGEIGRITDVQFGAGEAPLLTIAGPAGKKFEVPFAEAYLEEVDVKRRQVRMNLPEGMLEINAPLTAEEKQEQQKEKKEKH